jgi:hypothetical protein
MSYNVFPAPSADVLIPPGLDELVFGGSASSASYEHTSTVTSGAYVAYAYNELGLGTYDIILKDNNKLIPITMGQSLVLNLTTSESEFQFTNTKTWRGGSTGVTGTGFGTSSPSDVIYNNGLYIVVGRSGKIMTSTDLITWTSRVSNAGVNDLKSIAYGNNVYVTVGDSSVCRTSTDGITWTTRTIPSGNYQALGYGNGVFVAGSSGGVIVYSTDGITWTTSTTTPGPNHIIYGDKWVSGGTSGWIGTSTDGITWTTRTSTFGGTSAIHQLAYGNGIYMAVGATGGVAISTDAITWVSRTSQAGFGLSGVGFLAYGNGVFMVGSDAGSQNNGFKITRDGNTWATLPNPNSINPNFSFSNFTFNLVGSWPNIAGRFYNNRFLYFAGPGGGNTSPYVAETGIPSSLLLYSSSLGTLN